MANVPAKQEDKSPATLRSLLEGNLFKEQLALALPKHLTPERFIRIAVTTMNKVPMLAQCDQGSFFSALLTLSQLGLEPDGRRAYLIPFKNNSKGIVECQLIVGYQGLVELINNTGEVSNVHADIVCDNDIFEYDKGELKKHVIDFKKPRGAMYAAYAVIRFKDGTEKVEVMSKEEIEGIRKRSKAKDNGPWVSDFTEMAKKTVFRRASKWVKLSPEQRDAVEADDDNIILEQHRMGRDTGVELAKRMKQLNEDSQTQESDHLEPQVEAFTAEGLSGARLELVNKIGDMASGNPDEMCAVLKNISGGKVFDKNSLILAEDSVVNGLLQKVTGGK